MEKSFYGASFTNLEFLPSISAHRAGQAQEHVKSKDGLDQIQNPSEALNTRMAYPICHIEIKLGLILPTFSTA